MEYWTEDRLRSKVSQMRKKQERRPARNLGQIASDFFKKKVSKRYKNTQKILAVLDELLPVELKEHCCIEGVNRNTLKITVDSQAHYAEFNMLVRCGLADQVLDIDPTLDAFTIKLQRGTWYHLDEEGNRISEW